eukprot:GSChrysophyteH1.ASY1.ANO1.499.1 assembled CDS
MSFSGYVNKRNTPVSPPSMSRVYSVLWGTLWLDYENEEAAKNSLAPILVCEVLGVSEWDGQGRANQYPNSFLMMTHTGMEYYMSTKTEKERETWIGHIRRGLECHFANPSVHPYKPGKILLEKPKPVHNGLEASSPPYESPPTQICKCCGRGYSDAQYLQYQGAPLLQLGIETQQLMCSFCSNSQAAILWLKTLNYTRVHKLHEMTPDVQSNVLQYKDSFKLRRQESSRLDMAAQLLDEGQLTTSEFQELRKVDEDYRREVELSEAEDFKGAIDALGSDLQTIVSFLVGKGKTASPLAYHQLVIKVLEIADTEPELIDFYWPQLIQAHLLLASEHTPANVSKVDEIQQLMLVLSQKYPQLATKLAWGLLSSMSDYTEKKVTRVQYAACMCLLLQLEHIVTGAISCLGDIAPNCVTLAEKIQPADHQKQELSFEISVLFLARRRLQECYDAEIGRRVHRKGSGDEDSDKESPESPERLGRKYDGTTTSKSDTSCLSLLNNLGVGPPSSPNSTSNEYGPAASEGDDDSGDSGSKTWRGMGLQLDFAEKLTDLVDSLRNVERPMRTKTLVDELIKWNSEGAVAGCFGLGVPSYGWDPCNTAGEPLYRITRIIPDLCRVFRTKARAPSMIVCEVVRDDVFQTLNGSTWDENDEDGQSISSAKLTRFSVMPGEASSSMKSNLSVEEARERMYKSSEDIFGGLETDRNTIFLSKTQQKGLRYDIPSEEISSSTGLRARLSSADAGSLNFPVLSKTRVRSGVNESGKGQSFTETGKHTSHDSLNDGTARFDSLTPSSSSSAKIEEIQDQSESHLEASVGPNVLRKAKRMLNAGTISQTEYEALLKSDLQFQEAARQEEAEITAFKVESSFGESWEQTKRRVLQEWDTSIIDVMGSPSEIDLRCFIVKSNDDLRQEMALMQLLCLCREIFNHLDVGHLYLKSYRIIGTSNSTGFVEVLHDAMSIDALKKTEGFTNLPDYFRQTYGSSPQRLATAKKAFASSLAAYSVFSYLFQVKDRHNGNILIDTEGHLIHIDFGFLLGIAPGGAFSLETAPFKFTEEMIDVMDGFNSPLFNEFVKDFIRAFLALRTNSEHIVTLISLLAEKSPFPCFVNKDSRAIIEKLRGRFRHELHLHDFVAHCIDLIAASGFNLGTRNYDSFQWYTNGIAT